MEAYKVLGHPEGWREAFPLISFEEGVATHFLTSFDPNVSGTYYEVAENTVHCMDIVAIANDFQRITAHTSTKEH